MDTTEVTQFNKFIFYAETIEAYSFKVLFEILEKNFNYVINFKVNKDGIFICMLNEQNKLIIESSFYGKFMNEFEFASPNQNEEFLFGISISHLKELKIKKNDILTLSCEKGSMTLLIQISKPDGTNSNHYLRDINYIQNYIIDFPQGYCEKPININKSNEFSKLWRKIKTNDDEVNFQLMKNSFKLSFHDIPSIIIGKNYDNEILYEDIFKTKHITNIIKISSFGTLRIYYGKDLPILFSAIVGCNAGNINVYVSPYFEEEEWNEFKLSFYDIPSTIIRKNYFKEINI